MLYRLRPLSTRNTLASLRYSTMNFKLALSGLLSAALLSGCGSAPKLSEPEGQWEDMPFTHKPAPAPAAVITAPRPVPGRVQPAASPATQDSPLKTTQQKRPVTASPAKPAEAPPNDFKCSAS
ncbi:branched-chain amino acid ABC transporter ATP-binding protein [Pseudomonas syringae pv. coryli]|uniref:Branched-chain amino acid ABC transporter ATP-binding protein n=2 Tax=Pseudomonas syringae pv. coryli TaxID=317659 RepID=A0A0P9NL55_9PSED|nr:branched-chain amino acid ABC transporter ATP-binding protein [Pseudomonas syringae pv. coryli]